MSPDGCLLGCRVDTGGAEESSERSTRAIESAVDLPHVAIGRADFSTGCWTGCLRLSLAAGQMSSSGLCHISPLHGAACDLAVDFPESD